MNNRTWGVELEGEIDESSITTGAFHEDGSVDVCGRHRDSDNCNTDDCDCGECMMCENCDEQESRCDCDSCVVCDQCEHQSARCICTISMSADCEECKKLGMTCKECIQEFRDCYDVRRCATYTSCNHECGCCSCSHNNNDSDTVDGEVVSPIFSSVKQVAKWSMDNYPVSTNATCGGHIHVGLTNLAEYSMIMEETFFSFFKRCMQRWGDDNKINENSSFWRRLRGENSLLRDSFHPETQVFNMYKGDQRYTMVNYCWKLHGTVEFRLIPAFQKKELYNKILIELDNLITVYLTLNKPLTAVCDI